MTASIMKIRLHVVLVPSIITLFRHAEPHMNTTHKPPKTLAVELSVEVTSARVLGPYIFPKRAHHVLYRAAEMTLPSLLVTKEAVWRFIQVNSRPIATPFPQSLMTPLI